jgi:tripartite ATP-independent transporter DctM subunit
MEPVVVGLIGLAFCLIFIFLGVPMAIAFGVVGVGGIALVKGVTALKVILAFFPFTAATSFDLSVIPLFIIMGLLLFESGIGDQIFSAVRAWVGHLPGGLAASVIGTCALFGTITGSSSAATAVVGKMSYPQMRRARYQKGLAVGAIAAGGPLASMIPPSIVLVYVAILAEVSIGKVLVAGFIPGIIEAAVFIIMIVTRVKINPSLAPSTPAVPWRQRFTSLRYLMPAVIMFVIIIVGIYKGVFTPSEAGGVGTGVAFAIVLAMRKLNWPVLRSVLLETCRLTAMIMVLLVTIKFFTQFMIYSGVAEAFSRLALSLPSPSMTLILMFLVYLVLGCIVGSMGMVVITVPIFLPIVSQMGYDPIWFCILVAKMCEIAMITPPVAINLYIAQGIAQDVSGTQAIKGVLWFIVCDILTVFLFVAFPKIILFVPNMMGR